MDEYKEYGWKKEINASHGHWLHLLRSLLPVEKNQCILDIGCGSGEITLSCPYHGYLKNLVLALTGVLNKHFTALWNGGHIKFWLCKKLTVLLEGNGFKVTDFQGAGRCSHLWRSLFIKAEVRP